MSFCRSCGNRLPEGGAFCGFCGQPLASSPLDTHTSNPAFPGWTKVDPASMNAQTRESAPQRNVASEREEAERKPLISPLLRLPNLPASGRIPTAPGTPQISHIPTVQGTPHFTGAPSLPGQSEPGNNLRSGHAHHAAQPTSAAHAPHPGSILSHHAGAARPDHQTLHRFRRLWRLRHGARGASHAVSTTGTGAGGAAAVKVIVIIAIIASVASGAAIAAPRLFHPTNRQTSSQAGVTTQPMPATLTSCPAAGTARAMVSRPLVLGKDDTLVYIENTQSNGMLKRYNVHSGRTTTLSSEPGTTIADAQLSSDGQWVLFDTAVSAFSASTTILDKMQMIRLDGQGLQTLYCFARPPSGSTFFFPASGVTMSPDRHYIAFAENTSVSLLNVQTGQLQKEVPPLSQGQLAGSPAFIEFSPLGWMDNSHLYLGGTYQAAVDGGGSAGFYLADISHGPLASAQNLPAIVRNTPLFCWDFAENPARTSLYYSQCPADQGGYEPGTSSITRQQAGGGQETTVYSTTLNRVATVLTLGNTALLFFLDTGRSAPNLTPTGAPNIGWWKINVDGSGLTRLTSATGVPGGATHSPWANVSRDSRFYLLSSAQTSLTTLQIASTTGGAPTVFASASSTSSSAPQGWPPSLIPAGWTTA